MRITRTSSAGIATAVLIVVAFVAVRDWPGSASGPSVALPQVAAGDVGLEDLNALTLSPPRSSEGYRRDAFGPSWQDVEGNGCNQRDDVLVRDAVPGTITLQQQGSCDHDVTAGTWIDPYTGATVTLADAKQDGQLIPIDHRVPLLEAYRSGADLWSAEQRVTFANDLTNLRAIAQATNQQKSGFDPAEWLPATGRCGYARAWITTKTTWHLSIDAPEKSALTTVLLTDC